MLKLVTHTPGEARREIVSVSVARDIALVAQSIMRLPNAPKLYFVRDDSANNDIHSNGVTKGAKIIHRDRSMPYTDEYLLVLNVRRYSSESGLVTEIRAVPYVDRKQTPITLVLPASKTVELFTIEQLQ